MSQGFTRGVPIDTDPTLSLDSDLVVPSQKAVKTYVDTGLSTKQDTLTATKSVEIVANNIELDGDETSPTARKFYSTSGAAVRGWRTIEKLDLPSIVLTGSIPYVQNEFTSLNGAGAIIKIPGSNIIFVSYTTSGRVLCYDSITSEIKSNTGVAGALGLVYVATTGEVWAFGSTAASITRFTATTGVSLGATVVTGLTANCRGVYDDSSVTGNVFAYIAGTMNVINATTYVRTGVAIGGGSGSNELVLVTSGAQSGLLVGTVTIGVFGFDKSTNTLAYAPTTAFASTSIKYIPSLNRIVTLSGGNNRIYLFTPNTATTITLSTTIDGVFNPYYIDFDETENLLFVVSSYSGTASLKLSLFDLTTLVMIKSIPLTAITSNSISYIANDKANKVLYIVGSANNGSINKIIYA
jgi:hypothetical protein